MTVSKRPQWIWAIGLPLAIFVSCAFIAFHPVFNEQPDLLATAITLDLTLVAPLIYYLFTRNTSTSPSTVLRAFIVGLAAAGLLLSHTESVLLHFLKTWVGPAVECYVTGLILYKFYTANKALRRAGQAPTDFLIHCRSILRSVTGSEVAAHILAGEIAVFYYAFFSRPTTDDSITRFSIYKTNSILLVLSCFLGLFIIETVAMHFLIGLWSTTAAWILTSLSFYSCVQLYGHMRAIKARPVLLTTDSVVVRNGIMGGDATIPFSLIERIEYNKKQVVGSQVVKLALLKGLENHNLAIYLKEPLIVTKAFGITKSAQVLLVNIDEAAIFIQRIQPFITASASL